MPSGSTINLEFFQATVYHAQINSEIARRLNTVKARQQSLEITLRVVQELEAKLKAWRSSLPTNFISNPPFECPNLPPSMHVFHAIFLHFCYHGSLIAIHTSFCYPWNRPGQEVIRDANIVTQRQQSKEIVAESSRSIIMAVQRLQINAASPVW